MIKVAINGFGRIGRTFFRMAEGRKDFEIVAVNDLGSPESLAYLLRYDTAYGHAPFPIEHQDGQLKVNGRNITLTSEKDPANLPWGKLGIDVVVESTGVFTSYEKAKAHLTAGAKKVVITAPVKDDPASAGVTGATILIGANEEKFGTCDITSNASCTTNAASPLIGILKDKLGIKKALLNTVHAYTASQSLVDGPSKKDLREGRAAAQNIVPSTTGAAIATTLAYPDLVGKFDGISIRVPVAVGSIVDVTFLAGRATSREEVNNILKEAAKDPRWSRVFAVTDEPLVSSDIIGAPFGAIADLGMTQVVDGDLVKVLAWYDNEASYVHTLIEHVTETAKHI
ncbi:type I glyceraldehyde-3-phosphate dehydrogenase [Candidatus Kaiserbacteria bacterium RIFOXYB1_FULL_46_14]|uniref:Type I glyceraldehyde-3-phosphate dehydrogenase n=1 Tax=Candidatus Kaiserbacteria bacterium RIFOXYB1_FULL_46_14 TaxID=1798531 RepID=A0A1F6FJS3_9BACT|nr:MAG: type I glyceraldehyde-3-phosphate dehydrogenase [Candidatus Kaiserbacteria bacterium RIFOXYB1_FULL_46_14]